VDGKNRFATLALARVESQVPGRISLNLRAEGVKELAGFGLVLHYDPTRLTFLQARQAGDGLLPLANGATGLFVASSPSPGQVAVGVMKLDGSAGQGSGVLMSFTFEALDSGLPGDIGISDAMLVDLDGHSNDAAGFDFEVAGPGNREFSLAQNTPNPFNPETAISYALPEPGHVRLVVYNALGQEVRVLVDDRMGSGAHSVVWDGRDGRGRQAASGIYLYRMVAPGFQEIRRMVLIK
jgi:hypothetical protein